MEGRHLAIQVDFANCRDVILEFEKSRNAIFEHLVEASVIDNFANIEHLKSDLVLHLR